MTSAAEDVLGYERAMAHLREVQALAREMGRGWTPADYRALWLAILEILNARFPLWRERVEELGQLPAVRKRREGGKLSDEQIFEAFVKGALSGVGADWANIETVLPILPDIFHGFSLEWYASVGNAGEVAANIRRLGVNGQWLTSRMDQLVACAAQLQRRRNKYGSLEQYLHELRLQHDGSVIPLARMLGSDREHKLGGFAVPTAAEALKNCGFDLGKPDRHVNRAFHCFGIAGFEEWHFKASYDAPDADVDKLVEVMMKMEDMADCVGVETVLVDNAIWLLCAVGGLHLPNNQLSALRRPMF
ncbi:protein of unknown function [Cupriavidus taiwanensis]|nr:hypothetical protein CBM2595_A10084 [Cupriavidus taiwanensis]SOZ02784.1 hypothetical protein CBM2597_A10113 [Cupriavidus taiwanensis]SPD38182.1 protein of unknown function [Cupriavidus taiwanensis]